MNTIKGNTQIIHILPWNDVRHYEVSHRTTEKTRHETRQDDFRYKCALAMHINPYCIELFKHDFLLNDSFPESLGQQVIFAMQGAIYPLCIATENEINTARGIQNIAFIKKQWNAQAEAIDKRCGNDHVSRLIKSMEHHLVNADSLFDTIKKDLLFQLLFMPLYGKDFNKPGVRDVIFEWTHAYLGSHTIPGRVHIDMQEHFCVIIFSAIKEWREENEAACINTLLGKHYNPKLLKTVAATSKFSITHHIDPENGMLHYCHANIQTGIGNYYNDEDDFSINYIESTITEADANLPPYKTAGLKECPDIIA